MLTKEERLKDRRVFNIVFNIGKKYKQKINSELITLYFLFKKKDINKWTIKSAFIVSTKIDKKATKRNLLKRRMRAAYKIIRGKIITSKNLNKVSVLVWIANPPIKDATFNQIEVAMENIFKKLDARADFQRAIR